MRSTLVNSLEDLASPRTSRHSRALSTIECLIANACANAEPSNDLAQFLRLQDDFECNVASRLALYLMYNLPSTRRALEYSPSDTEAHRATIDVLTQPILQCLSILQGMSLLHLRSKTFLARRTSIQTLLDILSLSRHMPPPLQPTTNVQKAAPDTSDSSTWTSADSQNSTFSSSTSAGDSRSPLQLPALASAVLDTLLCILVDSPPAMRVFEEANGVEAVVKTLRRSGVAKDVRVRCLEFLYFYLLPEDVAEQGTSVSSNSAPINPVLGHKVSSRFTSEAPCDTDTTPPSSPPKSQQSSFMRMSSFTTQSTWSSSPMEIPLPPSPTKSAQLSNVPSLSSSPTKSGPKIREHSQTRLSPSSNHSPFKSGLPGSSTPEANLSSPVVFGATNPHFAMLRREVDFVPQSPKKKQISRLGVGKPAATKGVPIAGLGLGLGMGPGLLRRTTDDEAESTPVKKSGPVTSTGGESPRKDHNRRTPSSLFSGSQGEDNDLNVAQQSKWSTPVSMASSPDVTMDDMGAEHPIISTQMRTPTFAASPSKPFASRLPGPHGISSQFSPSKGGRIRTTAEKKEMLGAWLGNVDALVEGVQRAGVWGLA